MSTTQIEQYEYARKRIRQKKNVFIHFVIFIVGSIFLFIFDKMFDIDKADNWYQWTITAWGFLFVIHFIKVFITDSFMNKNWERHQIEKLVAMQERRIQNLSSFVESQNKNSI